MTSKEKVEKFILKLQRLIKALDRNQDLSLHQHINQFYYMQKKEELAFLLQHLQDATTRLESISNRIDMQYEELFCHWKKDVRKARQYLP